MSKITRIFRCENGHEYESDKPVESPISKGMLYAISENKNITCNGLCKICDSFITSEIDYVNDKIVMGAIKV